MQLSKPTADRLHRWMITVTLIVLGIPIALPIVWLVLSSLKTAENVLTDKPQWLPLVEEVVAHADNRSWPVTVVEQTFAHTRGHVRIKPRLVDTKPYFYWPADQVRQQTVAGYTATVGWIKRTVGPPMPADAPGTVNVELLGTQRVVPVHPRDLHRDEEVRYATRMLGMQVFLNLEPRHPIPANGDLVHLTFARPSDPFIVAASRVMHRDTQPSLRIPSLDDAILPVEIVEEFPAAGIARVRLVPGPPVAVPAASIDARRQALVHYTWQSPAGPIDVKPTHYDTDGNPVEVAIIGQNRRLTLPTDQVTQVSRTEAHIDWLGQDLTVRVREDANPPEGMLALQTISPNDTIAIAANRVRRDWHFDPQWANYIRVFETEPLHKYVLNTLFITALAIFGSVLSCGLVGYAFARMQFRGRDTLFLILLSTMMLPTTITFLPTYILYVKIGWLDTFYPMIVPHFLATAAFFVFLYRQYFMTIPLDLEDAARIDGCDPIRTFWHIMLPMAKPAVVTVTVFTFMATWNDFMGPLLYLNTDEYQTLAYGLYSFKTSFGYKFPHFMMAASTMMMIPTLIIFFFAQKAFMRGVVVTGVKG